MSSLTSSRIEVWRHQIESPKPPRGRTRKRAFEEMDNCPDLPHREHGPFEGQEPSKSRSSSPRKRQRQDQPTPPKTTVSQDASTHMSFAPPSVTSRGGSPNRRVQIQELKRTEPRFVTGSGKSPLGDIIITPDHIRALVRSFEEGACTSGCIPASIFDEVQEISQDMGEIPTQSRGEEDGQDHSTLLNIVKDVYDDANELFSENDDENAWYLLVRQILTYGSNKNSPLYIVNAQTKFVCQDLLPRTPGNERRPIGTVKVDFLLHFNTEKNHEVHEALNPWFRKNGGNLSAFNDSITEKSFSLSVVEVKPVGGDYASAMYQVMVASAAMQQRLLQLQADRSEDSLQHQYHQTLPVVGLAVIGHCWYLHIVFRSSRDCIVRKIDEALFSSSHTNIHFQRVLGPYRCGGTSSYLDIFRLFKMIDTLKQWGYHVYWKFLQEMVVDR
ncbi:hypothetical protein MMC07_006755 [Pseudocyphellaria aurata]|nr:hypothetical protein [Pseudocyphellaria aurata]